MISNLFDKNVIKIIAFFLISPGSRYMRREIKEKTNLHNVTLDDTLSKLIKIGLIKEEKNLFILNQNLPLELINLMDYLKSEYKEKLSSLPLKTFYILFDVSEKLSKFKYIKEVILFGSYAKLIYSEKSDIDLAIILFETKNKEKIQNQILKEARKIEKKYKKKIEIHFFTEKDMKHKEDPLIKDIIKNGRQILP